MRYTVLVWVCMLAVILAGAAATTAQDESPVIRGGIVNGKATKLPRPDYPEELRIAGIGGKVSIRVLIDEEGNVFSAEHYIETDRTKAAEAEPPHPLLVEAAREAAMNAKFAPTVINGIAARIEGLLVYNFSDKFPIEDSETSKQVAVENPIESEVLNRRAISLPAPPYPPAAKAVGAFGVVKILVTVDENGRVVSASAGSGHPLLKPVSVAAARQAVFEPLFEDGAPRRFTGIIVYNFALPD